VSSQADAIDCLHLHPTYHARENAPLQCNLSSPVARVWCIVIMPIEFVVHAMLSR
jgi:hypothetical protein